MAHFILVNFDSSLFAYFFSENGQFSPFNFDSKLEFIVDSL